MSKPPTLYEAVQAFLGPIVAEYGRIIDEGNPEMEVSITLGSGSYTTKLKLADLKRLDRAYAHAFDQKIARGERKYRGSLL